MCSSGVERRSVNPFVVGSIPTTRASKQLKNTNNKKKTIIINSNINNDFIIIKNLKDFKIDFNLYNIKVTDFCISKTIALKIVSDLEMDLIQISFNKKFSICIIDNLSNFLYNQKKKTKIKR